jgi:hypothetical protein
MLKNYPVGGIKSNKKRIIRAPAELDVRVRLLFCVSFRAQQERFDLGMAGDNFISQTESLKSKWTLDFNTMIGVYFKQNKRNS